MTPTPTLPNPVPLRPHAVRPEDVVWVYKLLLNREPESVSVALNQARTHATVESLCRAVMSSPEFRTRWRDLQGADAQTLNRSEAVLSETDGGLIRSFAAFEGPGTPGFVTDFLGTKTRVGVLRDLEKSDGTVEGYPIPGNFHGGTDEWAGTLRAVREADASREFVAVELGAGWGPWLAACAAACRHCGVARFKLVGLEAAATHHAFMRQHFLDNGLDPEAHTLVHGAAAAEDGHAEFPDLDEPSHDYGATLFAGDPLMKHADGKSSTRVPAYSIPTLLAEYPRVDLIHIDIQGSEAEVVSAARATLKAKVRRLVIGTHGRAIEQRILEDLSDDGWVCENDEACRYAAGGAGLYLALDGCQVWRNESV